ncbi:MAG: 30S ribosome-binding factor RbfA [Candidatus Limnocylindrales bacterium]
MAYKRSDRVNSLLQRELATIISEELRDPRIVFATVTSVETTGDLRLARIFVSVLGDDATARETMRALDEAKPYIRHEIGSRVDLRFVPEIEFVSDRSAARAARISSLLRSGSLSDPHAAGAADATPDGAKDDGEGTSGG